MTSEGCISIALALHHTASLAWRDGALQVKRALGRFLHWKDIFPSVVCSQVALNLAKHIRTKFPGYFYDSFCLTCLTRRHTKKLSVLSCFPFCVQTILCQASFTLRDDSLISSDPPLQPPIELLNIRGGIPPVVLFNSIHLPLIRALWFSSRPAVDLFFFSAASPRIGL